ncbi:MAG: formylglycine-generating enzyme family protein, partial [bacterium]
YIAVCEVTQDQWKKLGLNNPSHFTEDGSAPVESVTFEKATEFCNLLCDIEGVPRNTYRLPTEAEWEYSCRAGTSQSFCAGPDGGDLARVGWYGANSAKTTHGAGQKLPNAYGLFDMHGNVWEWCNDGERVYTSEAQTDPSGSTDVWTRITRGGGWHDDSDACRSANRGWARKSALQSYDLGLRVLRVLPTAKTTK